MIYKNFTFCILGSKQGLRHPEAKQSQRAKPHNHTSPTSQPDHTSALFGRAPRAAPAGVLPNGANRTSSRCGAGAGAAGGFQRQGGATFSWLQTAPPAPVPQCPFPHTQRTESKKNDMSLSPRGPQAKQGKHPLRDRRRRREGRAGAAKSTGGGPL